MTSPLWDRINSKEAEIVRQYMAHPPVKVGELATALGLEVIRAPLEPKVSGLIRPSATARAGFEIRVNKYEVPERQRFTVAHEIAHYLLHRDSIGNGVVDNVLYRSGLTSRKEAEANRLAAEIVMPEDAVRTALRRSGLRPSELAAEELARTFKVSTPAMKVRLGVA